MRKKIISIALVLCLSMSVLISLNLNKSAANAQESYSVSPARRFQSIDGWGTSLIWWAGQVGGYNAEGDDGREIREQIMNLIFGKDGLEYNIVRYNVPGGENPDCPYKNGAQSHMPIGREMEGFKENANDEYNWQADANQRWALDWVLNNVENPIVEYFSNSPPWYMTNSGCVSGAGSKFNSYENLTIGREAEFAKYFVDVLEHLIKVDGVKIDYINPFNESTSNWWPVGGGQEGCYFSDEQRQTILTEVISLIDERKLDVEIAATDCTGVKDAYNAYNYFSGDVKDRISKLNYHLYGQGDDDNMHAKMKRIANQDGQKKVWMSEMGYDMSDNLEEIPFKTAFRHSEQIRDMLKVGEVNAYVLWQIVEELTWQMGTSSNYGPIKVSFYDRNDVPDLGNQGLKKGSLEINKQYYVLGQYSKYIKEGYYIVETDDGNAVCAVSPDGSEVVIVKENNSDLAQTVNYNLDGYMIESGEVIYTDKQNNWTKTNLDCSGLSFCYEVSPSSVTTFVLKTKAIKGDSYFVDDSNGIKVDTILEENRFYLSSGWSGIDDDSDDYKAYSRGTRYANSGETAQIKFNGVGVEVFAKMKGDSASAMEFWIDGALIETKNLQIDVTQYGSCFKINNLAKGEHTLKIVVGGGYFNLDGVFIQKNNDNEYKNSTINDVSFIDGDLAVNFTTQENSCKILYKNSVDNKWIEQPLTLNNENGDTYTQIIQDISFSKVNVMLKCGDDLSNTITVSNTQSCDLLYYVDCGANNANNYQTFEKAGKYNSQKDKMLSRDILTGKNWGRTTLNNAVYQLGDSDSPYSAVGSLISGDGALNGDIEYKFEVGEGQYDIVIGAQNGWAEFPRSSEVFINGNSRGQYLFKDRDINYLFIKNVSPQNGYVTLKLSKVQGDNPVIGTIMLSHSNSPTPIFASLGQAETVTDSMLRLTPYSCDFNSLDVGKNAFVYYSDMTKESKTASFQTPKIYNSNNSDISGEIRGSVAGLEFKSKIINQINETIYYNIDCGSNGSNTITKGTLQGENCDQAATNSWGYMESAGVESASNDYETSIRYADTKQLRYKLTGLPAGALLKFEVGSNSVNWGARIMNIFVAPSADYQALSQSSQSFIGTIDFDGASFKKASVESMITVPENGELYVIALNPEISQHPQLSYIKVSNGAKKANAPRTDKKETSKNDTVNLSGLISGGRLIITDNDRLIYNQIITNSTMALQLGALDIQGDSVKIWQRALNSSEDSLSAEIEFPYLDIIGLSEDWSERKVLRFKPSSGIILSKIVVLSPSGKKMNVTDNEYYYYRALENGRYSITFTTNANKTFVQEFNIDAIDSIKVNDIKSISSWTDKNVQVDFTINCVSGIKEVYINDEFKGNQSSYSEIVTENKRLNLKVIANSGKTIDYSVDVNNIDKQELNFSIQPDISFRYGFKATVKTDNISQVTVDAVMNGEKVGTTSGIIALEQGEYDLIIKNGAGKSANSKLNVAFEKEKLKNLNVITNNNTLTVSAKDGTAEDVKVYMLSGKEINFDNGYDVSKKDTYVVFAKVGTNYEVLIFDVAGDEAVKTEKGCKSVANKNSGIILLVVVGMLLIVKKTKRREI